MPETPAPKPLFGGDHARRLTIRDLAAAKAVKGVRDAFILDGSENVTDLIAVMDRNGQR